MFGDHPIRVNEIVVLTEREAEALVVGYCFRILLGLGYD